MARKGSVSLIEQHLEKGVLGLAVLFTIGLGVYYLALEPNKVEFGGQKLGPRELDEAILRKAEDLQRAVQNAKPNTTPVAPRARELQEQFQAGLFGAGEGAGPPPPRTLPVFAQFGPPLQSLEEGVEADDVAVVTPLKPTAIVARTGISLVHRRPGELPGAAPGAAEASAADEDDEPSELSWVTVGGYFPLEAEQREMINAGYAGYRAKPYVVGVDVQRQEMTANGEFSDWSDVAPSKAMPKVDLPVPAFDDKTGELVNQTELEEKFDLIKASQPALMQSPFYPVEAGDEWDIPPLPGHEGQDEEEVAEAETPTPKQPTPKPRPEVRPAPRPAQPPPGGNPRSGAGGNPFSRTEAAPTVQQHADNPSKAIKDELKSVRKALKEKNWQQAEQAARSVANNSQASHADKAQANRLLREAEKGQQRQEGSKKTKPPAGAPNAPTAKKIDLVTNPDKEGEPAVWFHDDSVEPGKTYRYRMRVKLWNRYVGRRGALRDPAQATQTVLVGDWSLPGAPITVAPKQHFFVRGPALGEPAALIDVFTWYKGNWLKEDFKVRVGDVIGNPVEVKTGELGSDDKPKKERVDFSTGAIVLELRADEPVMLRRAADKAGGFAYQNAKALTLVYLDPADGQVKERISDVDRADPLLKRLKDEWDNLRENL